MPTTITYDNQYPTTIVIGIGQYDNGAVQIEVQYGEHLDRGICPLVQFQIAGQLVLNGMNQTGRYRIRARSVFANGDRGKWSNILNVFTPSVQARDLSPANIMIQPAMIVIPERVEWSCPSPEAGHPARLLSIDAPTAALWIRQNGDGYVMECETASLPIDTVALLATNASEECTVTISAGGSWDNARSANPDFRYGPVPFRASANLDQRPGYHGLFRLPAAPIKRYWRIVVKGQTPGNLMVVTYAVMGLAMVTRNIATNSLNEVPLDRSTLERDRFGSPDRMRGERGRTVDFELQNLREGEAETYRRLFSAIGTTSPALVVPNTKAGAFLHDRILFGEVTKQSFLNKASPLYDRSFTVQSLI